MLSAGYRGVQFIFSLPISLLQWLLSAEKPHPFAAVGQAKYSGHESRYHFSSDIAEQLSVTVTAVNECRLLGYCGVFIFILLQHSHRTDIQYPLDYFKESTRYR